MNELDTLINKYLQFDKKTLAELLAVKELQEKCKLNEYQISPYPGTTPQFPDYGFPYTTPTFPNDGFPYTTPTFPDDGKWIITCIVP